MIMDITTELAKAICDQQEQLNRVLKSLTVRNNGSGNGKIEANIYIHNYNASTNGKEILSPNPRRQGLIFRNISADDTYISFDPSKSSPDYHTLAISTMGTEYHIPAPGIYQGGISIYLVDNTATARLLITELSYTS